jgi:acetolactate synthase-1/3 small subunit
VKVATSPANTAEIKEIAAKFKAEIVEAGANSTIIQLVGATSEVTGLVTALAKFGVKELVQSGVIAMELGDVTLVDRTLVETGLVSSDSHSQTADYQN